MSTPVGQHHSFCEVAYYVTCFTYSISAIECLVKFSFLISNPILGTLRISVCFLPAYAGIAYHLTLQTLLCTLKVKLLIFYE